MGTTPKIPQKLQKNLPHTTIFFFTSNEQDTRKKKNNQKKTKQAREKEIMFLFLTPRFRKKRQLSCKIQGNTKSKLTRKTKILQKNPMKYTHKKVELKKKNLRKKTITTFFLFCCTRTCKTYLNRNLN